jgi:hypothetical protein
MGKPEGRELFGIHKRGYRDNIKMDIKSEGRGSVGRVNLAENMD